MGSIELNVTNISITLRNIIITQHTLYSIDIQRESIIEKNNKQFIFLVSYEQKATYHIPITYTLVIAYVNLRY